MTREEINEMENKINKYRSLDLDYKALKNILEEPKRIFEKYGSNEPVYLNINTYFGNGTNTKQVTIKNTSKIYDRIMMLLQEEAENILEEMNQMK